MTRDASALRPPSVSRGYAVVYSRDITEICSGVQQRLDEGWQLIGGITHGDGIWAQSLYKEFPSHD